MELLLFKRKADVPFATLKFPESYRIGDVYAMIVFNLDIEKFEYAYRIDGPYDPEKGLTFDKSRILLDPYAKAVTGQSVWGKKPGDEDFYKARVGMRIFTKHGSSATILTGGPTKIRCSRWRT